ncbi:MAG: alpha/beta hydrolase [Chloroflexi bacterium]|nr:alpha/beta hydrolase [Chloroflexota bacterium]MBV9600929.1 alpha/beta hydrolase [Chloroflexota bacterium]
MPDAILNGHKHHWEEAGAGEPLIMLHGAASSSRSLVMHLPALAEGLRVLVVDLRGMGRSSHASSMPRDWVADVVALEDHLGLSSAHLYGSSLGARIALRTAIDHPQRVKSLILDHPIIAVEGETGARLGRGLNMGAVNEERARSYRQLHGEDWQIVVQQYFTNRLQPEFQEYLNLREPSRSVTLPTLIVRGDQPDTAHPLAHACELAQNVQGAWLWIRPNTDVRVLNAAPEETYAVIRRFIAQVAGQREPVAASPMPLI